MNKRGNILLTITVFLFWGILQNCFITGRPLLFAQGLDSGDEPLINIGGNTGGKTSPSGPANEDATKPTKPAPSSDSFTKLLKAAETGDAEAQYQAARVYLEGGPVEKNEKEAVRWLQESAKQNRPHSQTLLGHLYKDGIGVPKDYFQAIKYFRPAIDVGFLKANLELGLMYFEGKGVQRDAIEAYVLLNLASRAIDLEPGDTWLPARNALKALEKELSPEAMATAREQMLDLKDRIIFRKMK